ncbi:MAG: hypothetical protein IK077_07210, partial [Thermoguttaceae bacterium]|nr:hypothetical protein [Thermoguttaceae bacterium]
IQLVKIGNEVSTAMIFSAGRHKKSPASSSQGFLLCSTHNHNLDQATIIKLPMRQHSTATYRQKR